MALLESQVRMSGVAVWSWLTRCEVAFLMGGKAMPQSGPGVVAEGSRAPRPVTVEDVVMVEDAGDDSEGEGEEDSDEEDDE